MYSYDNHERFCFEALLRMSASTAQSRDYLRRISGWHPGAWEVLLGDRKRNFELLLCDLLAAPSTPDAARHR